MLRYRNARAGDNEHQNGLLATSDTIVASQTTRRRLIRTFGNLVYCIAPRIIRGCAYETLSLSLSLALSLSLSLPYDGINRTSSNATKSIDTHVCFRPKTQSPATSCCSVSRCWQLPFAKQANPKNLLRAGTTASASNSRLDACVAIHVTRTARIARCPNLRHFEPERTEANPPSMPTKEESRREQNK